MLFAGLLGLMVRVQLARNRPRRPPKGSAPALAEPPRGPVPLQGGAEAPLEFVTTVDEGPSDQNPNPGKVDMVAVTEVVDVGSPDTPPAGP